LFGGGCGSVFLLLFGRFQFFAEKAFTVTLQGGPAFIDTEFCCHAALIPVEPDRQVFRMKSMQEKYQEQYQRAGFFHGAKGRKNDTCNM